MLTNSLMWIKHAIMFDKYNSTKTWDSVLILYKIKELSVAIQRLLDCTVLWLIHLFFTTVTVTLMPLQKYVPHCTVNLPLFTARWCQACCSWSPTISGPSLHQKRPLSTLPERSHWACTGTENGHYTQCAAFVLSGWVLNKKKCWPSATYSISFCSSAGSNTEQHEAGTLKALV